MAPLAELANRVLPKLPVPELVDRLLPLPFILLAAAFVPFVGVMAAALLVVLFCIIIMFCRCRGDLGLLGIRLMGDMGGDWSEGGDLDR